MKSVTSKLLIAATVSLLATSAFAQSGPNDNSRNTANRIGNNPSTYSVSDSVGATDTYDYYKFSLSEARSTSVALTGLNGEANIYLWGDNGTWEMGANAGNANELIRKQFQPGNYTILVYGWAGTVNYQLAVNTAGQASGRTEQIGLIDGMGGVNNNRTVRGNIGANERWVDYVFELPDRRDMTINIQTTAGAAASPRQTPQRWQAFDRDGNLRMAMNGGKHFVRVFGRPGQTIPFTLSILAKTKDSKDDAGNSFSTARNLGTIVNKAVGKTDYVGRWDFDDYYVFNAPAGSEVNADLVHNNGSGAEIFLYDSSGRYLAQSANGSPKIRDTLSVNSPQGGTYYLRVTTATKSGPNWQEANYTVRAGTVPLRASVPRSPANPINGGSDGDNDPRSPSFFGSGFVGEGLQTFESGSVGGLDTVDNLTLRVTCNTNSRRNIAPSFNVLTSPGVNVVMTRIPGNGTLPISQALVSGATYSPPKADYQSNTYSFEYRFAVTPTGLGISTYTLTANNTGCS